MSRDTALRTLTNTASIGAAASHPPAPHDALARPTNEDLIGAGLSLWPQGPAWGSPDGQAVDLGSNLARFTRVLVDPFVWLYGRAFQLAREATVSGVFDLLKEWETDYGLPDTCATDISTTAERIRALEAKVNSEAVLTPSDFIRVAAAYGFTIAIEEPAVFECGFSEIGDVEHELGSIREEVFWIVHVENLAVDYFCAGESECGVDRLFSIGDGERLLCILERISPAWTIPVLSLDALSPPFTPPPGMTWVYVDGTYPRDFITYGDDFVHVPL